MDIDVNQQLGLQLSNDEFDQLLKRLCFFAPTGSGDYVRELHDFVAIQTLSTMNSGCHSTSEIYGKILSTLGSRFEYEEIYEALRRLVSSGKLRSTTQRFEDPENRFEIQIDTRNRLRDQVHREEELESRVLTSWKTNLLSKYPGINREIIDQMVQDVKVCSFRLLSNYAVESLEVYYSNNSMLNEMINSTERQRFLDPSPVIPQEFELIRTQEVYDFFLLADEERRTYIAALIHSIFLLYITQLDKSCSALLRKELHCGTIYLDTNFVFGLVGLSGPDLLLSTQQLVKMTLNLGFKVVVSPRTVSEYEHALKTVLRDIRQPLASSDLARLALEAVHNRDFYSAYWEAVAKPGGVHVDPQLFFDYYEKLEAILEASGVVIDYTFHEEIMKMDKDIAIEASHLRSAMETAFGSESTDVISDYVLEHDAYHRLMILRYRSGLERQNFADAKAWFLTFDSKLPYYDRISRSSTPELLPFCVLSGQWLQLIRPYSDGNGEIDMAQVNLVVSPLLRAYPKPPNSLINSIITTVSSSSKFVPKAVTQMLSDRHFLEQFRTAESDAVRQDLIDSYYATYADEAERKLHQTTKQMVEMRAEFEKVLQEKLALQKSASDEASRRKQVEGENKSKVVQMEVLERKLDAVKSETEQKMQALQTENEQNRNSADHRIEQLLKERKRERFILKLAVPLFALAGYFIVINPLSIRPIPTFEIISAIVTWLVVTSMLFAHTRLIMVIAIIALLAFCASLIAPANISTAIQTGSSVFGVLAFTLQALEFFNRRKKDIAIPTKIPKS